MTSVFHRVTLPVFAAVLLSLTSASAMASIVITGTRVIYPADAKEVSVKLNNMGTSPVLVQSWIDNGDTDQKPDSIHVPFTLTPPINRVDGGKGQTLRLSYTGAPLKADKETVFWLNVLEVPAKAKTDAADNYLQMAFRTRIKLFFRPTGLQGNANDAAKALVWSRVTGGVKATNSTPYFVSLASVSTAGAGKKVKTDGKMIAPQASLNFSLPGAAISPGSKIEATYVNDYGAVNTLSATVN